MQLVQFHSCKLVWSTVACQGTDYGVRLDQNSSASVTAHIAGKYRLSVKKVESFNRTVCLVFSAHVYCATRHRTDLDDGK